MNILFIHQNFPGQFRHLAPALAQTKGNTVVALTMQAVKPGVWQGVQVLPYLPQRGSTEGIHPWVTDLEAKVIRAEALFHAGRELKKQGFEPDLVVAHPGWGESLFVKDVWPKTKLAIYCEFFYNANGADVGFDSEIQQIDPSDACRLKIKNIVNLLHFDLADAAISPTQWQASTYPDHFRKKITVVHDGIDTKNVAPNSTASIQMKTRSGQDITLTKKDEVVTFVNRNLEPYRGYHSFMRALPQLLSERPNARVIIVGGNDVSYGSTPPQGKTWKDIFISEVRSKIPDSDWSRVHFVGKLPYAHYLSLMQISTVHVYLTYPFVLSWSLLEAMSVGCAVVASDTAPVREVIQHNKTGILVDFFDSKQIAEATVNLLNDESKRLKLGQAARKYLVKNYDLANVSLPAQIQWINSIHGLATQKKRSSTTNKTRARKSSESK